MHRMNKALGQCSECHVPWIIPLGGFSILYCKKLLVPPCRESSQLVQRYGLHYLAERSVYTHCGVQIGCTLRPVKHFYISIIHRLIYSHDIQRSGLYPSFVPIEKGYLILEPGLTRRANSTTRPMTIQRDLVLSTIPSGAPRSNPYSLATVPRLVLPATDQNPISSKG